jgi:group I intron endonuclease
MLRISGIYAILNKKTGQVYVGQSNHITRRFRDHLKDLREGIHFSGYLQNAWNIYGEKNFKFKILERVAPTKKLLKQREQYWMDYYKSYEREKGYNLCPAAGSTLGRPVSEATRAKMRKNALGRKVSKETRLKMSKARKGMKQSLHTRKLISKAFTGMKRGPMSEAHKRKIGKGQIGRKHSKATRLKMSKSSKGRVFSPEHQEKLRKIRNTPRYKKLLNARRDPKTGRLLKKTLDK